MLKSLAAFIAVLVLALAPIAGAQSSAAVNGKNVGSNESTAKVPDHFYRVTLRVLEFSPDNKLADSRSYIAIVPAGKRPNPPTSIRSGDRVPNAKTGQFSYLDTGVKIDLANAEEVDHSLALNITADVATLSAAPPASAERPITRQIRWQSDVTIPVGKPAMVFSSDNASDRGRTELEVTANLIK